MSSIVESQNSGSEQQKKQEQSQQAMTRSRLVAKLLAAGPDIREFMHDLLNVQAIVVNGTEAAGFLLEPGEGGMQLRNVAHIRPDNSDDETRKAALQAFTEIIGECLRQGKDGVIDVGSPHDSVEPQFCLVTLLRNQEQVIAASCVITRARDQERAQQRLETMRLVAGYFDLWLLRRANEAAVQTTQRHQDVLQSAAAFANGETFNGASANLCNELVTRTSASRVSLGWVKIRSVKLLAMSHTEQFDRRQELSVSIVKAMEECVDQGELVQYDPDPTGHTTNNITRAAMSLSRMENGNKIVSLPLRHRNEVVGVLTLEYPPTRALSPHLTTSLAVAAEVIAPQIHDRYQNDRWIPVKIGQSIVHNSKYIIGPRHTLAKVIFVSLLGLALLVTLWSPMYRVSAPFQFTPVVKRSISAPIAGKLLTVLVEPGQIVKADDPLAIFDTDRLKAQREQLLLDKARALITADEMLNNRDPEDDAQAAQKKLEAKSLEKQILIIEMDIKRATVVAPIDGRILKGDLKEREKSEVKEGDALFEMASVEAFGDLHAEIRVNERDIQLLREGSRGTLATTSNPNDKREFTVTRIVPLGEAKDAKNVFRVYGKLDSPPDGQASAWHAGQEGEARIDWEKKPLYWHGTHRLWEWVRLKLWI
ncbi:MAG: HlyD family efflux transporter periplasmic adaptor subunit [Burkholderiales bacterium]|nr:HlyD family efflux transporter periplasmic adaptor subunit [Phycisphaerae bacterium]